MTRLDSEFQEMLWTCLDGSPTCVALFDPSDTLRLANHSFLEAFATTLEPAPTWESLMRNCHRQRKGLLIDTDDIDGWIARVRRNYRKAPVRSFDSDMVDGRWFSVTETTRPDGWLLLVASDVTHLKANETTLREARDQAVLASLTDPLTQLYNRRFIFSRLDDLLVSSRGMRVPLSVCAIDLDHFKSINDNHGHAVGDSVLRHFAQTLRKHLRPIDLVGRIGGEEFLLLMPNADTAGATQALSRVREIVRAQSPVAQRPDLRLSFSAGLTTATPDDTVEQIYRRADEALYSAKAGGRDRLAVADAAGIELRSPD